MPPGRRIRHGRSAWARAAALLVGLGCTGGTEPSANPRDLRVDPEATAIVWGYVYARRRTDCPIANDRVASTNPSAASRWSSAAGKAPRSTNRSAAFTGTRPARSGPA